MQPSPSGPLAERSQQSRPQAAAMPPAATDEVMSQQDRASRRPDAAVLREEIRIKLLGAAYDFLCAVSVALLCISGAVFYCRHRKRQMKRMGMTSSKTTGRNRAGGPRPPPWPPGRPGIAQGLSKLRHATHRRRQRVKIAEEVPLYSVAEDYGSSDDDDDEYSPALNASAVTGVGRAEQARYGHVPTVVVTDRAQVRHSQQH